MIAKFPPNLSNLHLADFAVENVNEIDARDHDRLDRSHGHAAHDHNIHEDKQKLLSLLHSMEIAHARLLNAQSRFPMKASKAAQIQTKLVHLETMMEQIRTCPEQGGNGFKILLQQLMSQILHDHQHDHHHEDDEEKAEKQTPEEKAAQQGAFRPEEVRIVVNNTVELQDDIRQISHKVEDVFFAQMLAQAMKSGNADALRHAMTVINEHLDKELKAELEHVVAADGAEHPEEHGEPLKRSARRDAMRKTLRNAIADDYSHRKHYIEFTAKELHHGLTNAHREIDSHIHTSLGKMFTHASQCQHIGALSPHSKADIERIIKRVAEIEEHLASLDHADPGTAQTALNHIRREVCGVSETCAITEHELGEHLEAIIDAHIRELAAEHGVRPDNGPSQNRGFR